MAAQWTGPMVVTVIGAVAAGIAAIIGAYNRQRINQVHVLVNSKMEETLTKLTTALSTIETLKQDAEVIHNATAKLGSNGDVGGDTGGSIHADP